MPLRTQAVCDRCGVVEGFGEKQSFPETPPPDWYGMKLTRRVEDSYTFTWGLLCAPCYAELKRWLRPSALGHHVPPRANRRGLLQGQLADRDALEAIFQFRDGALADVPAGARMPLVDDDQVVEALAMDEPGHALGDRVRLQPRPTP